MFLFVAAALADPLADQPCHVDLGPTALGVLGDATFDTDSCVLMDGSNVLWTDCDAPLQRETRVCVGGDLTLLLGGTLTITGSRPAVFFAEGNLLLDGTVIAKAENAPGPGGGRGNAYGGRGGMFRGTLWPWIGGGSGSNLGAAGGGFGGTGGTGPGGNPLGGAAYGDLETLAEGGAGGGHSTFTNAVNPIDLHGAGGHGGGGTAFVAEGELVLGAAAAIVAYGSDGSDGTFSNPGAGDGGGGGAGGGVLLASLSANGSCIQPLGTQIDVRGGRGGSGAGMAFDAGGGAGGRVYGFGVDMSECAVDVQPGLAGAGGSAFPGAVGVFDWDADGDGSPCTPNGDGDCTVDCNDDDPLTYPGAFDPCTDGLDRNCDGNVDAQILLYTDADHDGWGTGTGTLTCSDNLAEGSSTRPGDCDDEDDGIHPGALEVIDNGIDEDCAMGDAPGIQPGQLVITEISTEHGYIELLSLYPTAGLLEADTLTFTEPGQTTFSAGERVLIRPGRVTAISDADLDNWDLQSAGIPLPMTALWSGTPIDTIGNVPAPGIGPAVAVPNTWSLNGHAWAFPISAGTNDPECELCTGLPTPGFVNLGCPRDCDGDAYPDLLTGGQDCDDTDDSIWPGATEVLSDGIDQNCDGEDRYLTTGSVVITELDGTSLEFWSAESYSFFLDGLELQVDGVPYGMPDIVAYPGWNVIDTTDPNTATTLVGANTIAIAQSPFVIDVIYPEGMAPSAGSPSTWQLDGALGPDADANDDTCSWCLGSPTPYADNVECLPRDADGDGFPCAQDCDDTNPAVNPDAAEVCGNGIDEDCSGADEICPGDTDTDADADTDTDTDTDADSDADADADTDTDADSDADADADADTDTDADSDADADSDTDADADADTDADTDTDTDTDADTDTDTAGPSDTDETDTDERVFVRGRGCSCNGAAPPLAWAPMWLVTLLFGRRRRA